MADPVIRDDLSDRLVHLTRGDPTLVAAGTFLSIVEQRVLRGGDGFIKGGYRCVCFSEAPIGKLAHLLAASAQGTRYKPFGVMVDKAWLFSQGGRPVIYQPETEFALLHESQRYRHVRYEPPAVDFTWERGWRVCVDELPLDPAAVTLVVLTRAWERWFQRRYEGANGRRTLLLGGLGGGAPFPWHFVVLEDIGVDIPIDLEPPE